jgi:hypothetical protein
VLQPNHPVVKARPELFEPLQGRDRKTMGHT